MSRLTAQQEHALNLLRRARDECPSTDDGVMSSEATYYDQEIHVAYVHFNTARVLRRRGLVTFGGWDPDYGTSLTLTDEAAS